MNRPQIIVNLSGMHATQAVFAAVLLLAGLGIGTFAQAQISNPSFENVTALPNNTGQWDLLVDWDNAQSATATPDCFHAGGSFGGDLPETPVALLNPFEGQSVAGIAAIQRVAGEADLRREYLVNHLGTPLVPGQRYRLKLHWTNGQRTPTSPAGWAASGWGVAFTSERPAQLNYDRLPLTSVFETSYPRYSENWEQLSFEFVASADEQWMVLGAFQTDAATEVEIRAGEQPSMAYYFFDALSIEPIEPSPIGPVAIVDKGDKPGAGTPGNDGDTPVFVPSAFTPNNDGINDRFIPVLTDREALSVEVFDRWGALVVSLESPEFSWDGCDMAGNLLPGGDYIWQLLLAPGKTRSKTVLHGRVSLVR